MGSGRNLRFRHWYDLIRRWGIIKTQSDLCAIIISRSGKPVSQTQISHMLNGQNKISDSHINAISGKFSFTHENYFLSGTTRVVNRKLLLSYLKETNNVVLNTIAFQLKKDGFDKYTQSFMSQLNDHHDHNEWQILFDFFNQEFGYRIKSDDIEIDKFETPEFTTKNEQTKRFLECIEYLIEIEHYLSWAHAAKEIGTSPQMLTNMKTPKKPQSVTVDMLIGLSKDVRRINLRYILLGEGKKLINGNTFI